MYQRGLTLASSPRSTSASSSGVSGVMWPRAVNVVVGTARRPVYRYTIRSWSVISTSLGVVDSRDPFRDRFRARPGVALDVEPTISRGTHARCRPRTRSATTATSTQGRTAQARTRGPAGRHVQIARGAGDEEHREHRPPNERETRRLERPREDHRAVAGEKQQRSPELGDAALNAATAITPSTVPNEISRGQTGITGSVM